MAGKWTSPTGYNDPDNKWIQEEQAYDNDITSKAKCPRNLVVGEWNITWLELTIDAISCGGFRFWAGNGDFDLLDIDLFYDGIWNSAYYGTYPALQWVTNYDLVSAPKSVTKARIRARSAITDTSRSFGLREFQFWEVTPPEIVVPTVTTQAVSGIQETYAYANGNITALGNENCDRRGFCWNTTGNPTLDDDYKEVAGSFGTGAFCLPIPSLGNFSPGTKYYVKAYAHNSAGYGYDSQVTFVTKPNEPSSLLATPISESQINLTWTKGEGAEKTMVRYKKGSYPTSRSDGTQVYFDTGTSYSHTSLDADETYYYRAWSYTTDAPNSGYSDNYSEDYASTASAIVVPTVTTQAVTDIEETTAKGHGGITGIGGQKCDLIGICWDEETAPNINDNKSEGGESGVYFFGTWTFDRPITGLKANTKYYVRAYAHNSKGYAYGNEVEFTTTLHIATTPVIENPGFEEWITSANPFSWDVTGSGTKCNYPAVHSGEHSIGSMDSANTEIKQDLQWDSDWRGKQFTFKVYIWHKGALSNSKIGISDDEGVTTTWSDEFVGVLDWEQKSVTKSLAADATGLRVIIKSIYNTGAGGACRYDDASIQAPAVGKPGATRNLIEFNGNKLAASGATLAKLWAGKFQVIQSFPVDITSLCVFQNRLYIAQGWSEKFWYTPDLLTFTQCTLSDSTAKHIANIGSSQFIISDTSNTLRISGNPINDGCPFSTPYTLPNSHYNITGLMNHDEVVYVRKQDQVYYLSGEYVYSLIPVLVGQINTSIDYPLHYWKGKLYIPSGINSLYEYDNGIVTDISIVKYAEGHLDFDEEIAALASDEEYLYAAVNDGDDVQVLAGRWEIIDGSTRWVWHPLYTFTSSDITAAFISGIGDKRLYLGTTNSSDGILTFIVPYAYADILHEDGYKAIDEGEFIGSWLRSNFPSVVKFWKTHAVTSVCITDKTNIAVYCQKKGQTDWTFLGNCEAQALVDGDYPPELTTEFDIEQSSERMRFKRVLTTSDDDFSPILHGQGGGLLTKAKLLPVRKKVIDVTILVAPSYRLRDKATVEEKDMQEVLGTLRSLYEANAQMVVIGPDGVKEYTVLFDREGYGEQLAYNEIEKEENYWVTLKLLEV